MDRPGVMAMAGWLAGVVFATAVAEATIRLRDAR